MATSTATRLAGAIALAMPAALLGGAFISQYGFGLFPCEMCWWQRYPHFIALAFAVLARARAPWRTMLWVAATAMAVSGLIGGFHAGVEYGWWEGLTACTANPLAGGGDPLEAILNAPLVRCDLAPWSLFGISLAGWNFLFSIAAALAIAALLKSEGETGS